MQLYLTLNVPSLSYLVLVNNQAGVLGEPHVFFVISQRFDAVDYSNYIFGVSETIIQ
jgi:hypothetical protein